MADNIDVTPGTGKTIAADEIAAALHQRVKITIGADGVNDGDVSSENPMPVSAASLPLPSGAATEAKQDTGNTTLSTLSTDQKSGAQKTQISKADGTAVAIKDLGVQVATGDYGLVTNSVIHGLSTADGSTYVDVKVNPSGALSADVTGSTVGIVAGSALIGKVNLEPETSGGLTMHRTISAATTNATNVKASAGQVYSIQAFNNSSSIAYLKLYDTASAPTVGTDVPVKTLLIPANTDGAGLILDQPMGLKFTTGISFAITGGIGTSDTTAIAANQCAVNIDYV